MNNPFDIDFMSVLDKARADSRRAINGERHLDPPERVLPGLDEVEWRCQSDACTFRFMPQDDQAWDLECAGVAIWYCPGCGHRGMLLRDEDYMTAPAARRTDREASHE